MRPATTVIIFGTFDIFHKGHINFIKQARAYGDSICSPPLQGGARGGINKKITKSYLIAVIARDKTVREIKGSLPRNNEKDRLNTLRLSGLVDKAVLGSILDKYAAIRKYKPDIICLGYDQNHFVDGLCGPPLACPAVAVEGGCKGGVKRIIAWKNMVENNKSSKNAKNLKSEIPDQPRIFNGQDPCNNTLLENLITNEYCMAIGAGKNLKFKIIRLKPYKPHIYKSSLL